MEAPAPDWPGLPADILTSVLQLLECPDLLRSASVCTAWHTAVSALRRVGVCPACQTPCLLYCTEAAGGSALGMYSLSERKAYTMPLPEPPINNWIGSSDGWIVTMDEKSDLTLLNPITGDRIALPPATAMEHVKPILNDDGALVKYSLRSELLVAEMDVSRRILVLDTSISKTSNSERREYVVSYYKGGLPRVEDTPYVSDLDEYGGSFCTKAILSSDPSKGECHHPPAIRTALAKVGDVHWNWLEIYSFYADCIYHDGWFYAMTPQGAIDAFNLNGPSVIHKRILPNVVRWGQRCYIVEAPWGDVLQVDRKQILDHEQPGGKTYITKIEVYKVDFAEQKRIKMTGIGDHALFIGKSTTSCFSVKDHPDLMPNHVYFTDDHDDKLVTGKDDPRDIGVYNLGTNTTCKVVSPEPWRTWFPPIWLTPNLAKTGFQDNNGGRESTAVINNQSMKASVI